MNRTTTQVRSYLALMLLAAAPKLMAQATPQAPVPATDAAEETITLDPFSVTASEENGGYAVKDTLAGTRIRTELKDVASSLSVINAQFLQDTGAKNTSDLLVYTTNTEVGGVYGNFSGAGGSQSYSENATLLRPSNNTRVRGLDAADNTRDYFLSDIPWDGYNVDRVDMQRGPNSILFGVGSPAGIINTSINGATYKTGGKFENRIGQYSSVRNSFDYNHVFMKNQLAARISLVDDQQKFRQKPSFERNRRIFGAVKYEPRIFGSDSRTTIRANVESGDIRANRPRTLPPIDAITPWFYTGNMNGYAALNKLTLDVLTQYKPYNENKTLYPVDGTMPWLAQRYGRSANNSVHLNYDATNGVPTSVMTTKIGVLGGIGPDGLSDHNISDVNFAVYNSIATYSQYARRVLGDAGAYYGDKSLADPTVFDFYNKLMDGPNKGEYQKWHAYNLALSQTFFADRLGAEFVFDSQSYEDGQKSFLYGGEYVLSIDINSKLMDGSANPNLGRPFVGNSGQYSNTKNFIDRESMRFTAFGDLRAQDLFGKNLLSRILGHHVITGLLSQDQKKADYRSYARWSSSNDWASTTHQSYDIMSGQSQVDWVAYLGGSLLNKSTASGANLSSVSAKIDPAKNITVRYFDDTWTGKVNPAAPYTYTEYTGSGPVVHADSTQSENSANYVGWRSNTFALLKAEDGDIDQLWTQGQKSRNKIKSQGITWQGYLFDGSLVPVFGWRKDTVTNISAIAPTLSNGIKSMDYAIDPKVNTTLKAVGESKSYGAVAHLPKSISDKLPGQTSVSLFFNKSQNFKADAPRADITGQLIPNPQGRTTDYGVAVTTLNDRLTLKVTHYKTSIKDATLQSDSAGFGGELYRVWATPYWHATHALAALDGIADPQRREGNWGWPWNGIATLADGSPDKARIREIVQTFFTKFPLTQDFMDAYGIPLIVSKMHENNEASWYLSAPAYGSGSIANGGVGANNGLGLQPKYAGLIGTTGGGAVAFGDTTSKGLEFEATAQITKNWSVTANASKTDARRTSIADSVKNWIDGYTAFLATDAGLVRQWGGDTFRKVWNDNIVSRFNVLQKQIGQQAPEIAEWRYNVINNYNFSSGFLKGANVGGAYRWEGDRVLGYEYSAVDKSLDVTKPYKGGSEDHLDIWIGYGHKVTKKLDWRIQVNLRNVGEHRGLVPVNINPDGTVALSRIKEGMGWTVTNTFTF